MSRARTALLCALSLFAAQAAPALAHTGEVLQGYYVDGGDLALVRDLNRDFDVERKLGNGYEVIVPEARAAELLRRAPQAMLVEKDIRDVFQRADLRGYHDYDSVQSELHELASSHSGIATVEDYGQSQDGRTLTVMKLTGTKTVKAEKPEILITSSTHGDELTTVELTMGLINKLVAGYGTDDRITKMLDSHVLYFIPVLCPDGYVHHTRYTNGVDPNRNYPYPSEPDRKPNAALAAEIAWVADHDIKGSLDIHSNLATVMYPYAYSSKGPDPEDLPRFRQITQEMAEMTGYNWGQIANVFGIARGSSADYWYWKHKTIALGYEVGGSVVPPASQLQQVIDHNTEAIWHFVESF